MSTIILGAVMYLNLKFPKSSSLAQRPALSEPGDRASPEEKGRIWVEGLVIEALSIFLPCWRFKHFLPQLKKQHFSCFRHFLFFEHSSLSLNSQLPWILGHLSERK